MAENNVFQRDRFAQRLWEQVCEASGVVENLMSDIAWATVRGEETYKELRQARALLRKTAAILERTNAREGARYNEADAAIGASEAA